MVTTVMAARDTMSTECNLLVPDSPVTKICTRELMSSIYCMAWFFYSLQQAKTFDSKIQSN